MFFFLGAQLCCHEESLLRSWFLLSVGSRGSILSLSRGWEEWYRKVRQTCKTHILLIKNIISKRSSEGIPSSSVASAVPCSSFLYDPNAEWRGTILKKYNMVCDRARLKDHAQVGTWFFSLLLVLVAAVLSLFTKATSAASALSQGIYFLSVASGDGQAISVGSVQDRYVHLV